MNDISGLILLPRLRVQNANAIAGPLSWGFPSPTAFAGFVHALERKLAGQLSDGFAGVGIVCHHFDPQVTRAGKNTFVFNLKRMMVRSRKECNQLVKDGTPPAFVEEGRAHMEISLLIAVRDYFTDNEGQYLAEDLQHAAYGMRLAGGSPLYRPGKRHEASWHPVAGNLDDDTSAFHKLRRRLLPGFALVERDDLLVAHLEVMRESQPESTALDALLDLCRLNFEPVVTQPSEPSQAEAVKWEIRKNPPKPPGWLVPLPIGYAGISPLYAPGEVANSRDPTTPFRFVESLYSLGQWISPHRLDSIEQLLWTQESDPEAGLYRCRNRYTESRAESPSESLNPTLTESETASQEHHHG